MTTPVLVLERIESLLKEHFQTIEKIINSSSIEMVAKEVIAAYNQGYEKAKEEYQHYVIALEGQPQ